ncbi:MAG: hypothetical protein DRP00_00095 [Candidatus Aenigmatarchaeota archaeon]|nr:MAG: hypothetical protein DRP00_00095 [Candidatus Aenigmarchaeota archaeon]
MPDRMVINDLIILGRGCPERIRNGRVTVCTAGYSPTHGFIRIYPTKMDMPLERWSIVRVPVERNPRDTRRESWKIVGSKTEWGKLHKKVEVVGELEPKKRLNLIANLVDDCVEDIRKAKRSLGIVKPIIKKCYFSEREDYDASTQLTLLGYPVVKTKNQFPVTPRIRYKCSNCKSKSHHDQQVLEWGFYEWIRKCPDKKDQVWENARIFSKRHKIFFFVGSLFQHRARYVIISVLRIPKDKVHKPLFPHKK